MSSSHLQGTLQSLQHSNTKSNVNFEPLLTQQESSVWELLMCLDEGRGKYLINSIIKVLDKLGRARLRDFMQNYAGETSGN